MSASRRRGLAGGIVFAALGVLFLLEALEVFTMAPSTLWPVLLISLGIGVLAGVGGSGDSADE